NRWPLASSPNVMRVWWNATSSEIHPNGHGVTGAGSRFARRSARQQRSGAAGEPGGWRVLARLLQPRRQMRRQLRHRGVIEQLRQIHHVRIVAVDLLVDLDQLQ